MQLLHLALAAASHDPVMSRIIRAMMALRPSPALTISINVWSPHRGPGGTRAVIGSEVVTLSPPSRGEVVTDH
jgi:hypothetical protein